MKKLFVCFFAIAILSACDKSDNVLQCGDYEITKELQGDSLSIIINSDPVVLKQTKSTDGVRYAGVLNDTDVVLWNHDKHWTLFLNDESPIECE